MKVMVFDVGGTEIKYSVMDEQMNRFDAGSVPTPQDTQEHFLDTIYALYAPHKDEVDGIAMALPGFVDANTGYVSNGGALLYNTGTQVGQLVRERCGCRVTLDARPSSPSEKLVPFTVPTMTKNKNGRNSPMGRLIYLPVAIPPVKGISICIS